MKLKELLAGIDYELIQGSDTIEISNISWDSRKVKPDSLFICIQGRNIDRHEYAATAAASGAAALVIEHAITAIPCNITIIKVADSKAAMAEAADNFYGSPSKGFTLIGITGTNGKTSVSCFAASIMESVGRKPGIIGTIENRIGSQTLKVEKINPTTPDSIELQASFREMRDEGVTDVVMEVTSAALENHRVDKSDFDVGVFTNLTQDHLDEHGTMENYKNAKMKLFGMCKKGVINADDPAADDFIRSTACSVYTYGIDRDADFMAKNISYTLEGVFFTLNLRGVEKKVSLKVPGRFSVYNALAAAGACYCLGLTPDEIAHGLSLVEGVRGRFEAVPNTKGCLVIVDYAHTPDGLSNILGSVRELARQKLITVFGCGGDRDRSKRSIMGEIAGRLSDLSVITSDNPRTEDPVKIIEDIEEGIKNTGSTYLKIIERRAAIYQALDSAQEGDIVVIAGKGHETYQIFGDKTIHFDDVEVVRKYFDKVYPCL